MYTVSKGPSKLVAKTRRGNWKKPVCGEIIIWWSQRKMLCNRFFSWPEECPAMLWIQILQCYFCFVWGSDLMRRFFGRPTHRYSTELWKVRADAWSGQEEQQRRLWYGQWSEVSLPIDRSLHNNFLTSKRVPDLRMGCTFVFWVGYIHTAFDTARDDILFGSCFCCYVTLMCVERKIMRLTWWTPQLLSGGRRIQEFNIPAACFLSWSFMMRAGSSFRNRSANREWVGCLLKFKNGLVHAVAVLYWNGFTSGHFTYNIGVLIQLSGAGQAEVIFHTSNICLWDWECLSRIAMITAATECDEKIIKMRRVVSFFAFGNLMKMTLCSFFVNKNNLFDLI